MTVLAPAPDDLFIFRITKYHQLNPKNRWVNTYEFKALDSVSEGALLVLGTILVQFEQALHLASTIFDRLLISTWEEDSKPYDPNVFVSTTLTGIGLNPSASVPISLEQPLVVTRAASTGRVGHLFYRNVLTEDIVSAPAGRTILDHREDIQTLIDGAMTDSGLDGYIGATPSESFGMCMVNKTGTQVRPVIQIRAQGVTTLKTDHKWFNRTVTPTP
jgi:hypothetical protein